MTADDYVNAIKQSAKQVGTKAVTAYILAAAPYLMPIKFVIEFAVGKLLGVAIDKTEMGAFFIYVDMRSAQQSNEFERAAIDNYNIQRTGTDEQKKIAEANLILTFKRFIKLSN